jgi:hypothetical protein
MKLDMAVARGGGLGGEDRCQIELLVEAHLLLVILAEA